MNCKLVGCTALQCHLNLKEDMVEEGVLSTLICLYQ